MTLIQWCRCSWVCCPSSRCRIVSLRGFAGACIHLSVRPYCGKLPPHQKFHLSVRLKKASEYLKQTHHQAIFKRIITPKDLQGLRKRGIDPCTRTFIVKCFIHGLQINYPDQQTLLKKALAFLRDEIREDREDLLRSAKAQRPGGDKENKPTRFSKLNEIDPEGSFCWDTIAANSTGGHLSKLLADLFTLTKNSPSSKKHFRALP